MTFSPQGTLEETVLMYVTWTHVNMSPHVCTNLAHPMATPVNVGRATMGSTVRASKRIIFGLGFLIFPGSSSPKVAVFPASFSASITFPVAIWVFILDGICRLLPFGTPELSSQRPGNDQYDHQLRFSTKCAVLHSTASDLYLVSGLELLCIFPSVPLAHISSPSTHTELCTCGQIKQHCSLGPVPALAKSCIFWAVWEACVLLSCGRNVPVPLSPAFLSQISILQPALS